VYSLPDVDAHVELVATPAAALTEFDVAFLKGLKGTPAGTLTAQEVGALRRLVHAPAVDLSVTEVSSLKQLAAQPTNALTQQELLILRAVAASYVVLQCSHCNVGCILSVTTHDWRCGTCGNWLGAR
jgi:lipopolysaccharide biosynthesis regulator YciM